MAGHRSCAASDQGSAAANEDDMNLSQPSRSREAVASVYAYEDEALVRVTRRLAGAAIGGAGSGLAALAGAVAGAAMGAFGGPPGAAAGGVIGGVVGALAAGVAERLCAPRRGQSPSRRRGRSVRRCSRGVGGRTRADHYWAVGVATLGCAPSGRRTEDGGGRLWLPQLAGRCMTTSARARPESASTAGASRRRRSGTSESSVLSVSGSAREHPLRNDRIRRVCGRTAVRWAGRQGSSR